MHALIDRRRILTGLLSAAMIPVSAQPVSAAWDPGSAVALCVGCQSYEKVENLVTPAADATLLAAHFQLLGFDTKLVLNPAWDALLSALVDLRMRAEGASIAVVYVAGHGVMHQGELMVFPVNADAEVSDKRKQHVPERLFVKAIADKPRQKILMFDACRSNTLGDADFSLNGGGPSFRGVAGTMTAYATQPGAPAFDGDDGHSPFAKALAQSLSQAPQPIEDLLRTVRLQVVRQTSGLQVPWSRSSLLQPLSLHQPMG